MISRPMIDPVRDWFKPGHLRMSLVIATMALMAASMAVAELLRPNQLWSDRLGAPRYAELVPNRFGDWVELDHVARTIVDPVQAENLARIYSETLSRTYLHRPTGRVVMLSIAYGRDQSTDTQLHTPEQCYPSQGFRVENEGDTLIPTAYGPLKAVQMATRLSQRQEPLTFFIRVGDRVVRGSKERNLERLRMGLQGFLVDGMLLRVSEITSNADAAYALQQTFIADMLRAVTPAGRRALIGSSA